LEHGGVDWKKWKFGFTKETKRETLWGSLNTENSQNFLDRPSLSRKLPLTKKDDGATKKNGRYKEKLSEKKKIIRTHQG